MKKVILILAVAIVSLSCSTGETPSQDPILTNCDCGQVIQSTSFNLVNGQGGVNVFSVIKIKNNCTDAIIQTQRDGNIPVGSQICNY